MQLGEVLAGRYRVDATLGEGGFGLVFRALDLHVGRPVAVKLLRVDAASADAFARFAQEAEIVKRLEHPNTVRIYDFGRTQHGAPFVVWELLEGESLESLIARGPMPPLRALHITAQVLKSLMEAHAAGVIHRDIKPANIFLCRFASGDGDFVKVIDFGIAKSPTPQRAGAPVNRTEPMGNPNIGPRPMDQSHTSLGTPAYMAPEQVSGEPATPATDLYSLGLVLAEMLTGQTIFQGDSGIAVCMQHLSPLPAPIPVDLLQTPLGPFLARATAKRSVERFSSAAEMLAHLEALPTSTFQMAPRGYGATAALAYAPTAYVHTPPRAFGSGSVPAVTAPMEAPTARMEAPKPAGRSRALVAAVMIAALLVVAVSVLGVLAVTGNLRFDEDRPANNGAPKTSSVHGSVSKLTVAMVRDRAAAAGYVVTNETTTHVLTTTTTTWNLGSASKGQAQIQLFRFADASSAVMTGEACDDYGVSARDGGVLLCAAVFGDPSQSKALLNVLTR